MVLKTRPLSDLEVRALTTAEVNLVEELRLAGNEFFRTKRYRDAELLYRSGLGLMALGPEGMAGQDRENNDITLDTEDACPLLSPEDNRRAATLLLNLAQALLNLPSPSRQATAAAAEAIRICKRASFHLEHIDVQQSDQIGGPVIPAGNLVGLTNKARIRKALAMERCANVGGAMMELLRMHGRGPADEGCTEWCPCFMKKCKAALFCQRGKGLI
ncbi:hypothetical protein WJX75_002373 [Coccomyxa subellipsoidea]|uniref:Uncharacterized protein n=1 Tax=Coccomyxa subellipsoidea TaxID=248742 RepID=A0ABR2YCB0_9CHLO